MTSGGNNINYFPDNQLTKFIAVPPKISMTQHASFPRRIGRPWSKGFDNLKNEWLRSQPTQENRTTQWTIHPMMLSVAFACLLDAGN